MPVLASPIQRRRPRALGPLLFAGLAMALGGCKMSGDVTGSIGGTPKPSPGSQTEMQAYVATMGKKYDARPTDPATVMEYARVLRSTQQYPQAVAVLQTALLKNGENLEMLGAYGKALADAGRLKEAADTLARAHTPERPNWSILSAQGSVADQLGDHDAAQGYYQAALRINPGDPGVLSNLGLSYALARNLQRAEQTLRQAVDHPRADARVRQNFSLVLALEGKFDEAEQVARRDLSPADAAASVASIRQMIAQSNTWRDIQKLDSGAKPKRG